MMDYFVFNGISSADCGIYVVPLMIDSASTRDIEKIDVPGRNGSIIIDNGRYLDSEQSYTGFVYDDTRFDERITAFKGALLGNAGYKRLEDTFKPDEYRMAYLAEGMEPQVIRLWNKLGKFKIRFTCKPQRYLKIGEKVNEFAGSGSLFNPSVYPAQPMIRVYGYGELSIGGYIMQVSQSQYAYIDIDCERMNAYSGSANCNSLITLSSDFPVLCAGETEIDFDNTFTKIEIMPRWWVL